AVIPVVRQRNRESDAVGLSSGASALIDHALGLAVRRRRGRSGNRFGLADHHRYARNPELGEVRALVWRLSCSAGGQRQYQHAYFSHFVTSNVVWFGREIGGSYASSIGCFADHEFFVRPIYLDADFLARIPDPLSRFRSKDGHRLVITQRKQATVPA